MLAVNLKDWGWSTGLARQFSKLESSLTPGRVISDFNGVLRALSPLGELEIKLKGKFRLQDAQQRPVVGDWVAIRASESSQDYLVDLVLDRQTEIIRQAAGRRTKAQVLAANVDLIFVVSSLDQDFSPRRLERYLVTAWESGARPVILLSKLDLCATPGKLMDAAREVAMGVPVIAYSALTGMGVGTIRKQIKPDTTVVLLGSSGVGKSTLVNALLGVSRLRTGPVRDSDKKGRHITTHRELVRISSGGLLIDTPGLRELQIWEASTGLEQTFPDLEAFARDCRFNDCTHEHEPGCSVIEAVESDALPRERYESYLKLRREGAFQRRRRDMAEALAQKRSTRSQQKQLRKQIQEKDKT